MCVKNWLRWVAILVLAGLGGGLFWSIIRIEQLHERMVRLEDGRSEPGPQSPTTERLVTAQTGTEVPGSPGDRYEVSVVAKQYGWKFQHPDGRREIGELHVPVGRPILLYLISEDVNHSLVVPDLNLRVPAEPARYTAAWASFPKPGRYPITCGQECGPQHQLHTGAVVAVEPAEFNDFLAVMFPSERVAEDGSLAWQGRKIFLKLQCLNCHSGLPDSRGPTLEALFDKTVKLTDGKEVSADEAYFRESILTPQAKIVQGWKPIMPSFEGKVNPEELTALVAYLRSLKTGRTLPRNEHWSEF